MVNENSVTKNTIRIGEDWDSFLNEHPELHVEQNSDKIMDVIFPKETSSYTLFISNGVVYYLEYCIGDKHEEFVSLDTHKSKIDEFVKEFNRIERKC